MIANFTGQAKRLAKALFPAAVIPVELISGKDMAVALDQKRLRPVH